MIKSIRLSRTIAAFLAIAIGCAGTVLHAAPTPPPLPAPDNSSITAQYIQGGLPPIDKPWTVAEYQKAGDFLQGVAKTDVNRLPRYKSPKSGDVFARMIAQENLHAFYDKSVAVEKRMALVESIPAYLAVFSLYANGIKPENTFDAEALELGGFILRAELAAAEVAGEFVKAHPEAKTNPTSAAGLHQMRDGFAQTAGGIIDLMMDHTDVRVSEATRFAGQLKDVLPRLSAQLLPEAREKLKEKVKDAADKEEDPGLKTALRALLAGL